MHIMLNRLSFSYIPLLLNKYNNMDEYNHRVLLVLHNDASEFLWRMK